MGTNSGLAEDAGFVIKLDSTLLSEVSADGNLIYDAQLYTTGAPGGSGKGVANFDLETINEANTIAGKRDTNNSGCKNPL